MRLAFRLWPLIVLAAICAAQDTNFSTGPQYLITGQSTMFLHSIETPSLSFGPSSVGAASAPAPPLTAETLPASQVIETPSEAPAPGASEIEISGAQPPQNLPAGFIDVGVTAIVDAQSLRGEGYGISLAEAAAYWKAHGGHASHTFTNKDVERSPGS
jgi:hypothetical protein